MSEEPAAEPVTPPVEDHDIETAGLSDEQLQAMLALAGRFKDDPEFIERGRQGIAEYRRKIQEEVERELAEAERK